MLLNYSPTIYECSTCTKTHSSESLTPNTLASHLVISWLCSNNEHNITGRVKTIPCKELSTSVFIISTQKVRGTMCDIKVLNLLYSLHSCILKIITFSVRTLLNYPFIYLPQLNLDLLKVFPFFLSTSHFCNIYMKHFKYIKHIYFRLHIYYLLNIFTICFSQ